VAITSTTGVVETGDADQDVGLADFINSAVSFLAQSSLVSHKVPSCEQ
jgi:hypothetical protein